MRIFTASKEYKESWWDSGKCLMCGWDLNRDNRKEWIDHWSDVHPPAVYSHQEDNRNVYKVKIKQRVLRWII